MKKSPMLPILWIAASILFMILAGLKLDHDVVTAAMLALGGIQLAILAIASAILHTKG